MNRQPPDRLSPAKSNFDYIKLPSLAIVGASIGNLEITAEIMRSTTTYLSFADFDYRIMVTGDLTTGGPGKWNYLAIGYSEASAKRNAVRLTHRMHENLRGANIEQSELIDWISLYQNEHYLREKRSLTGQLPKNAEFSKDINDATAKHLARKLDPEKYLTQEMIDIGTAYIIEELALMLAAPQIFGRDKVYYCYHKEWPVFQKLIAGKYDGISRSKLGMLILRSDWDYEI